MTVTGADIARAALGYLGVPYVHLGRSGYGLDCAGLVLLAARDLGLTDWDDTNYTSQPDEAHLRACLERFCARVCCGNCIREGDVLLMAIRGRVQHLAIVTAPPGPSRPGRLVHAYQTPMKVVEHSLSGKWRRRVCGIYRWRGVESG